MIPFGDSVYFSAYFEQNNRMKNKTDVSKDKGVAETAPLIQDTRYHRILKVNLK